MKAGFVCAFGMSTYYVLKLVEKSAKAKQVNLTMEALPIVELKNRIQDFDIILLGPQLKYKFAQVQAIAEGHGKKVVNIPFDVYGSMDGDKVLKFILESL